MSSNTNTRLISEKDAARILGYSVITLRKSRWDGQGALAKLAYLKFGRSVRYSLDDIETFIQENRVNFSE